MVSIVTVSYRTKVYLEKMLESLFAHAQGSVEVLVVENGSGEDLSSLKARFPAIDLIVSKQNLGFAGGCNLGIARATGDYILLVNPDILFESDAIAAIESRMNADKEVSVGGISLKNLDGSQQACVWHFPRPLDQLLLLLKIPHVFPNIGPVRHWLMKDFDYTKTQDVDQVMGAFFCIRRAVIDQIGPLDHGFFMWYEEVDFCRRAAKAGWKVRFYADISARHKKGSSFETVTTLKKQAMVRRSLRRYMRKHFGWPAWLLFTLPEPIYVFFALIASVIKPR